MGNTPQTGIAFVDASTERIGTAYTKDFLRGEFEHLYWTREDFSRADPTLRRVVFIGCTGAGKSTLLNVIGGWRYVQAPPDYETKWEPSEPVFKASAGGHAVTCRTEFANLRWFGNEQRCFIAIDTPGHDDTEATDLADAASRDRLEELAVDLHDKLKAIGHLDAIVIIHNDVLSNRLNPATYKVLKMIDQKFAKCNQSVWKNTVIAYSKCNEHETSWRSRLDTKKRELRTCIQENLPSCTVDIPVIALGGLTVQHRPAGEEGRSRSRSPRRSVGGSASPGSFEELWRFIETTTPLETRNLQPYEGDAVKWQRIIDARDDAEARAKAASIYLVVVTKLAILFAFLFWRSYLIPSWMSKFMFLNFTGPMDEAIYFCVLAYWIGPNDVWYSCKHFFYVWIRPFLPYVWQEAPLDNSKPHED